MLELLQVNAYYGASHVLRDIDLSVRGGEIVSILGRNGVGKTTLLKSILGLDVRTRGTVTLDGQDITTRPTYLRARAGIGYVPQGRELIPDFLDSRQHSDGMLRAGRPQAAGARSGQGFVPLLAR